MDSMGGGWYHYERETGVKGAKEDAVLVLMRASERMQAGRERRQVQKQAGIVTECCVKLYYAITNV
jgi:hypothetical protein